MTWNFVRISASLSALCTNFNWFVIGIEFLAKFYPILMKGPCLLKATTDTFTIYLNIVSPPEVGILVYLNIVKKFAKFCWHLYLLRHRATAGHRAHVRPVWMQSILAASVSGIFLTPFFCELEKWSNHKHKRKLYSEEFLSGSSQSLLSQLTLLRLHMKISSSLLFLSNIPRQTLVPAWWTIDMMSSILFQFWHWYRPTPLAVKVLHTFQL